MQLSGPYQERPIRFLEPFELDGWRTKVYGISARGDRPPDALVQSAKRLASQRLPRPAAGGDRYGAAILICHEARESHFVLLDWWTGENMLQHRVYAAPLDAPDRLEDFGPSGIVACVWELHVLAFERRAWIETVLANPSGPDLDAYWARRLDTRA